MKKKLSIITINYNNLEGLKKTVESVVNQTWREFEFVVIDGGSIDGSTEYLESQSGNIDYWVSEPDKGIYNAMNKGIAKATGEYLLFLNSGDHLIDNDVLVQNQKVLNLFDIVYFNLYVVDGKTTFVKTYPDKLSFSYFVMDTLPHQATFIRAALFDKIGSYDESLTILSDWKFFMESIFKFNSSYLRIDGLLSTFYLDGISSDLKNRELLDKERVHILNSDFKGYIEEINQLLELRTVVSNLRKSKKIRLLIKLGLLNKF
jgi:glycosyltransferase involved in cell wall biosynthesis